MLLKVLLIAFAVLTTLSGCTSASDDTDSSKNINENGESYDGYEFNQTTNSHEDSKTIEVIIKIKPENLDSLINFAGTQGEIIYSSINSEDITDSYYDSEIQLASLRNQLEKYNVFLQNTESVEEMLNTPLRTLPDR